MEKKNGEKEMIGIKDMDMPCDCWNCGCAYEDYRGAMICIFTRELLYPMGSKYERSGDCPLVEIAESGGIE